MHQKKTSFRSPVSLDVHRPFGALRTQRKKLAFLAAACAAAAGIVVAGGASMADAAANCTHGTWHLNKPTWNCHNVSGATVYGGYYGGAYKDGVVHLDDPVGHLYSNPSWFICRIDDGPWNGGGPHPYRWLWTQSDDGGQGWVADSAIYDETNPVIGCGEY